jgi:hypothetical protein
VVPITDDLQPQQLLQPQNTVDAEYLQQLSRPEQQQLDGRGQAFSFKPQQERHSASPAGSWGSSAASSAMTSPARSPSPGSRPASRLGAGK